MKITITLFLLASTLLAGCANSQSSTQPASTTTAQVLISPTPVVLGTTPQPAGTTIGSDETNAPAVPAAPAGGFPAGGAPGGMGMGQSFNATPAFQDLPYASVSSTQKLDIYLPKGNGPFPVVLNFHAGGFKFGDKTNMPGKVCQALLDGGIAVAGVNYRLSDEATFPAAVLDARAAVRFLRANAAKYNLDPERIGAFGQSAGGNIAAMLGTTGDGAPFDDASLGNPDVSNNVQVVVDWFGPTDFGKMDEQAKAQGCSASDQTHGQASSFESVYLGSIVSSSPDLVAKANPITYIDKKDPPFLIQKGDQDCTVAVENTKMLADALKATGVPVEYDLLPGAGHGDTGGTLMFESDANVQKVVAFFKMYLK